MGNNRETYLRLEKKPDVNSELLPGFLRNKLANYLALQRYLSFNPNTMKNIEIDFFSAQENKPVKETKDKTVKAEKPTLTGYISPSGKVVLPARTVTQLGVNIEETAFKVGKQQGKRKAKSLYMVPEDGDQTDTFRFTKAAKSYTMLLPVILQNNGVDYTAGKHTFVVKPFDYNEKTGLELTLSRQETEPKKPYTGKPRGRKPKVQE